MLEAHVLITDGSQSPSLKIELTFDDRQKSRHRGQTTCGQTVGWFIERGHVLTDGNLLGCTSGDYVEVVSAPESVSTVYVKPDAENPALDLTRAAYHLGNRHVPLQITETFLRYQHDHVLDEMVIGLGLLVESEQAPFQPEPGAYSGGHSHGHSHGEGHSHSHEH